jgi:isoleucyl-tRNA synthetase
MDKDLKGYGASLAAGVAPDTLRNRALAAIDATRFVPPADRRACAR